MPESLISIDATGVRVLGQKLKRLPEQWPRVLEPEIRELGKVIVRYMRLELEEVRYTGALERSVSYEYDIYRDGTWDLDVGPTAKHAPYVRFGTKPHWAPIEPLKRWARWKLGDESAAYAVRSNIAKYGTSLWAELLYGVGGANPFPERTKQRIDVKSAMARFTQRVGRRMVQELGK